MELMQLGIEPISPESPAGVDARYDPAFEALQAEVDKMSSPTATGGVDWARVRQLSSEVLSGLSKDILAAGYLAVSLIHTGKLDGFEQGLRIMGDLVETYWETLFPAKARLRGRIAAIEWWVEKSEGALAPLRESSLPEERLEAIRDAIDRIDRFLSANLEEPPSLRPVWSFADTLVAISAPKAPEPPPPPQAAAPAPAAAPASEAPARPAPAAHAAPAEPLPPVGTPEEAAAALDPLLERLGELADTLREADPSDPMAFRLSRIATWATIADLPHADDGRTGIPPPPAHVEASLRDFADGGEDRGYVGLAETVVSQCPFWLDLHYHVHAALSRLGDGYAAAARAVLAETAAFALRMPGLADLAFSDGSPMAGDGAKAWLARSAGGGSGAGDAPEDPTATTVREAKLLAAGGRLAEGVRRLQRQPASGAGRERFEWRLALCGVLLDTDPSGAVVPLLDEVVETIDRHRLDEFEPALAIRGLKLAYSGYRANADRVTEEKISDARGRLSRLDLAATFEVENG
jgi:type VI secretion system protein VasJ